MCAKRGIEYVLIREKNNSGNPPIILSFDGITELSIRKYDNNWFYVKVSVLTGWVGDGGYADKNFRDFVCNEIEGLVEFITDLIKNKKYSFLYEKNKNT